MRAGGLALAIEIPSGFTRGHTVQIGTMRALRRCKAITGDASGLAVRHGGTSAWSGRRRWISDHCKALSLQPHAGDAQLRVDNAIRSQIAALFVTMICTMIQAIQFAGMLNPVSSLEGIGFFIGRVYPALHFLTISRGVFNKALGFASLYTSF